jgi:mevalonate kinase
MNGGQAVARGQGHGKVILLGEHSVVHGRPAIAAGLARGCIATAEFGTEDSLTVEPWGVRVFASRAEADAERELLRRAFALVCEMFGAPIRNGRSIAVRAEMQVPSGAGLGSSAALSVAVLRAMDALLELSRTDDAMLMGSLAWERVFHGNPSGVDSAMAIGSGLARYVRTERGPSLTRLSAACPLHLVIGNSAEHGSTKRMVERVAEQLADDSVRANAIFDGIASLVESAQRALVHGDYASLGPLLDENQRFLVQLQLSTDKLDDMCQLARAAGALGAKLTGGGGGGCMLALARDADAAEHVSSALSAAGHAAFVVEVSA